MSKLYQSALTLAAAFLLSCILPFSAAYAQTSLFVNEIMASNNHTSMDATGSSEDWIEIYNPSDIVVDMAGYYISDKTSSPKKHKMPSGYAETRIAPHGYLVIWASEKPERGPLHAGFALSASGENVVISAPDGALIDAVTFGLQATDVSYGRYPDGASTWTFYSTATPGAANGGGTTQIPKLSPPQFSVPGGFKTALFELSITHPDPGVTIRVTSDGSEPSEIDGLVVWKYKNNYSNGLDQGLLDAINQSYRYNAPLLIGDRSAQPNRISMKSSTLDEGTPRYIPEAPVFKGTVIRAKAFKAGNLPSETVTSTYFVTPSGGARYAMPVISLVSDERSFFDYTTGIYTAGRAYDRYKADNSLNNGNCGYTNFTMDGGDWERRGNFELFENGNTVFSQGNIGIRVHGFCSRQSPQKSLRIYSDTNFDYNFFPGHKASPKRFLLRTRGNEPNIPSEIKDLFCQKLVEYLPFDSQAAKPAILFMNGEYYGFQSIRERFDRYYLENKYNVGNDNVDLIQLILGKPAPNNYEIEEGDDVAYKVLMNLVHNSDLNDPINFEKLKTLIDLDGYTDYQIAQTFIGNVDWPHNNLRLWRAKLPNLKPGAPAEHDGRWRFMFFDADFAFFDGSNQSFDLGAPGENTFRILFNKLLQNQDYRKIYASRVADLANTHFTASRATGLLDQLKNAFDPLMDEHIERWKEEPTQKSSWTAPQSRENWQSAVTYIRNYANARPAGYRNVIRTKFGAELADQSLWVGVSDPALGYVRVNKIDILPTTPGVSQNPYPWTGIYFKTIPIQLTAIPKPDGFFDQWQGPNGFQSKNPVITLSTNADALEYYAIFQKKPLLSNLVVNGTSLTPGFVPTTADYEVSISPTTESVSITPTFGERANRVAYTLNNGTIFTPIADGVTSSPLTMAPGRNRIRVRVFDFDGFGAKFYTVVVNRPMSTPGYTFNFAGSKLPDHGNMIEYVAVDKRIETANFTLEAWIRTSDNSTTGSQGYEATSLFNSDKAGSANDFTMGILNNKIAFYDGSISQSTFGGKNVVDGRWHHVAVVREAQVAVRIYVDGELDTENTSGAGRATLNENSYIALGGNPGYAPQSFQGSMDEVRIWTTARTAMELMDNMRSPLPTNSAGLKAYYTFDIGINDETTTVADLSGNGNTAAIGNTGTTQIGRTESYAMVVPSAAEPSGVSAAEFTANWAAPTVGTAERYFLDVSTSEAFVAGSFLAGYEALEVSGTSHKVTIPSAASGRVAATDHYYRVRADKSSVSGQGAFSETVRVVNPLPVTLISFQGRKADHGNLLEWNVSSEIGFDRYEIERSIDARTFGRVGTQKAVAEGKGEVTKYSFLDYDLPFSTSSKLYYRLKMIDRAANRQDESFALSKIIFVANELPGVEVGPIYPNPSSGKKMYVSITVSNSDAWTMSAFSAAGILVNSSKLPLKKGTNRITLPCGNLSRGLYLISFKNSAQQEIVRKLLVE
jgi:hypothetical protein